jgi:hypothetical protein
MTSVFIQIERFFLVFGKYKSEDLITEKCA